MTASDASATISNTTNKIATVVDASTAVSIPDGDNNKDSSSSVATKEVQVAAEETPEQRDQRILTHQLLARQVEYYFSVANLSRDTYLSTLRGLNDGYAPLSIIANFGKVQSLAPYGSAWDAVYAAASDHSDLLEMVELDEKGKKITTSSDDDNDNSSSSSNKDTIILAVGTVSGEAIPMSQIQSLRSSNDTSTEKTPSSSTVITHPSSPTSTIPVRNLSSGSVATKTTNNVQNTIIIREVSEDVEEKVVRSLFDVEECPSIQTIHLDLHNCWFVTLDTSSRDEMVNVMMKLRTKKFPSGDSVKARLKSSVSGLATPSPLSANAVIYTHPKVSTMYAPQFHNNNNNNTNTNGSSSSNSRKKRSSNHKGRNNNGNGNRDSNNASNNGNYSNNKAKNQQVAANGGQQQQSKRKNSKDESSTILSPSSSSPSSQNIPKNNINSSNSSKVTVTVVKKLQSQPPSISMGEVNFPSLPPTTDDNSKPFQVEKVPTEDEMMRGGEKGRHSGGFSDSSSTATTTSTSSTTTKDAPSSSGIVTGGYAAALLRPAAAPAPATLVKNTTTTSTTKKAKEQKQESAKQHKQQPQRSSTASNNGKKNHNKNKEETSSILPTESSVDDQPVVVSITPPSWGRGRSFADVLSA